MRVGANGESRSQKPISLKTFNLEGQTKSSFPLHFHNISWTKPYHLYETFPSNPLNRAVFGNWRMWSIPPKKNWNLWHWWKDILRSIGKQKSPFSWRNCRNCCFIHVVFEMVRFVSNIMQIIKINILIYALDTWHIPWHSKDDDVHFNFWLDMWSFPGGYSS